MILAETDALSTVVIGLTALVALGGGLFGMAVAVKQLFFNRIDPNKEFITRGEFAREIAELEKKLQDMKMEMTGMISLMRTDVATRIDKMETYAHTVSHEQSNMMNNLMLKVERLLILRENDIKGEP